MTEDGLEVKDELQYDQNEYFTCEYNRFEKKMTQIGVSVDGAERVVVKQFDNEIARLTYDEKSSVWYHKQQSWIEDTFTQETDSIFGINAGGYFSLIAYDENSYILAKTTVNITPGTMSIEEYNDMQHEVRRLFEIFSYDLSHVDESDENLLRRVQLPFYPQRQFQELIKQFSECFAEISQSPEHELIQKRTRKHIHQVKKWTPSIIIEDAIKQSGKVNAKISEKITEIKEHRMIRFMLEEFFNRIKMELSAEQRYLDKLEDEYEQLEEVESKENSSLVNNFRKLKGIVKSDCEKLKERSSTWLILKKETEELLNHPLLQIETEEPEETHLFRMHPTYSRIYDIYIDYEQLSPELSDTFRLFIQSILKSPTLYEIWILLKVIQQLSQWGVRPYEFVQDVKARYLSQGSISGYNKLFKLEDKPFNICLYYDYSFNDKGYRPDFVIGFYDKQNRKWYMNTFDAKYKNYSKMKKGSRKILNDLEHSGTRYLNELFFSDHNLLLKSATVVHPDIKSINWNVKQSQVNPERKQHRIGHFYLTPHRSKNLSIYFKRLLHECCNFGYCCPTCGKKILGFQEEINRFNDKLGLKTTYLCEECEEVWVSNFCSSCFYNGIDMSRIRKNGNINRYPKPLYKYPIDNYNLQVGDNWDVHCPSCNKTAKHWLNYTPVEDVLRKSLVQK
jgi:hypothetical protein